MNITEGATRKAEPDVTRRPTPIRVSRRTWTALIVVVIAVLAYVVYLAPSVVTTTVGGIALWTALLFLAIQQLEGNFLTPTIQGDTLHVHPILVFLAVIAGGGLGGIFGVIVAVPALAVLRVLFDFFRVRLRPEDQRKGYGASEANAPPPAEDRSVVSATEGRSQ